MIPPLPFFDEEGLFFRFADEVFADREAPVDCLAPPDAVRLPGAPLLVPVDDFEPPPREEAADFAAVAFEPAFLAVPADFVAPVLLTDELFDEVLFVELPVFEVAEVLLPLPEPEPVFELPCLETDADLAVPVFDELLAVAID